MTPPRYNPITLRGPGPNASEIILRDRDRFWRAEQPDEAAPQAEEKQSADEKTESRP